MLFLLIFLVLLGLALVMLGFSLRREPPVKWPFRQFRDKSGIRSDVVALTAPFRSAEHLRLYESFRERGVKVIGFTHYQEFPESIRNPHEDMYHKENSFDYIDACDGWCYFHRDPDSVGLPQGRRLDIVESDFADCARLRSLVDMSAPKRFDFVYCLPRERVDANATEQCTLGWQAVHRNWTLAEECIKVLCAIGLRGIIVGRTCSHMQQPGCVHVTADLPYQEFLQLLRDSRFLFLPGIVEASPRKLTEALCLDTPVLMNRDILGGWKYMNAQTGAFFTDEKDVAAAARKVLRLTSTRAAFEARWGKAPSSRRLAAFLRKLDIDTDDTVMLKI